LPDSQPGERRKGRLIRDATGGASAIARLLQEISQDAKNHRGEIREMLMRSDPFALSLA